MKKSKANVGDIVKFQYNTDRGYRTINGRVVFIHKDNRYNIATSPTFVYAGIFEKDVLEVLEVGNGQS